MVDLTSAGYHPPHRQPSGYRQSMMDLRYGTDPHGMDLRHGTEPHGYRQSMMDLRYGTDPHDNNNKRYSMAAAGDVPPHLRHLMVRLHTCTCPPNTRALCTSVGMNKLNIQIVGPE